MRDLCLVCIIITFYNSWDGGFRVMVKMKISGRYTMIGYNLAKRVKVYSIVDAKIGNTKTRTQQQPDQPLNYN